MMDFATYSMELEIKDEVKDEVIEEADAEDAIENANSELKLEERIDSDTEDLPSPPNLTFELSSTVQTEFDGRVEKQLRNSISKGPPSICSQCPKSFPNILRRYRNCNSFPTSKALEEHVLNQHDAEHDNKRVEFSCFTCDGRNFMDQKGLNEHIKQHHINNVSVLLSRNRALLEFPHFERFLVLDAHVPRKHSDPIEIVPLATATTPPSVGTKMQLRILTMRQKCPHCNETFAQKFHLKQHMKRLHPEPEHRVRCPHCPLTFFLTEGVEFQSHMLSLHNQAGSLKSLVKCPRVAETHSRKSKLTARIEAVPSGPPSRSRIKCPRCPLTFLRDQTLKCHMRKRHTEDSIDSIVWEAEPESPDNIESQLKCPHCDKTFSQAGRLPNHIKRHHSGSGRKQIQCPQCPSLKFSHNSSLEVHIMTHHNKERDDDIQDGGTEPSVKKPLLKCPQCAAKFTGKSAFTKHMESFHRELNHNPVSRKNCPHCDKTFLLDSGLTRHISAKHLMQRVACHLCDKTFSTGSAFLLKKHLLKAHCEPRKSQKLKQKLKCRYCNRVFLNAQELRHHVIQIHIKQNKTTEKKDLPNPVKEQPSICTKEKESEPENSAKNQCQSPRVQCPKCQLTFSNSKHLQFHIILQHVENKTFPCLICTSRDQEEGSSSNPDKANAENKCKNFIFKDERKLDEHMKSTHYTTHKQNTNLEKPPEKVRILMPKKNKICTICSKSFDGKYASSNYRGHMETHLGVKRYSCEHCCKQFSSKLSLHVHLIRYHNYTSEQLNFKYACQLCPFISINQDKLNYHMGRKHPGQNLRLESGEEINIDPHETELNISDANSNKIKNITKNPTDDESSAVCFVCSKIQTSRRDLIQHLKGHRGEGRFYCDLCPRDFAVRMHLTAHLNLDHHKSVYCNKCFTSFTDAVSFNRHVLHTDVRYTNVNQTGGSPVAALANENSPANNLQCEICDESSTSPCLFKIHTIFHLKEIQQQEMNFPDDEAVSADNIFKCSACPSAFDRQSYLNAHLEIVHQSTLDISRVKCSKCEQTYKFLNELKTHDLVVHSRKINQHINQKRSDNSNGESRFECNICLSKFETASELTSHENKFGSEVLCHICPAKFTCKSRLNTHLRAFHKETDGSNSTQSFLCHICPSKFIRGPDLERHVRQIHEGKSIKSQTFSCRCRLCPDKFFRVRDLRSHAREMHEGKYNMSLDFCCHLCSCKYTRDQDLRRHVQRMHGDDGNTSIKKDGGFPCNSCSIAFAKKQGLLLHISDHHTDDALKAFECNICQRTFNAENILKIHVINNHRHTPYFRCEVCFIRIRRRIKLKQHLKEEHNRAEYCQACKRSFETRADVDKHLERNPSETLSCGTCHTDYPSQCLLNKHCNKLRHDYI